jgi:hypothetical protein
MRSKVDKEAIVQYPYHGGIQAAAMFAVPDAYECQYLHTPYRDQKAGSPA